MQGFTEYIGIFHNEIAADQLGMVGLQLCLEFALFLADVDPDYLR